MTTFRLERIKNVGSRSKRGKKRLPDRGMEKRKHKVLASGAKQAPFNEDMKAFMTQLFEQNFSGMEQRIQKRWRRHLSRCDELKQSRTQGVEGLSQTPMPGFDPSQTKEEDWWTPMTSVRGSVDNPRKKEKTEMNTAPPPQWEKWCKRKGHGLQLSDSPLQKMLLRRRHFIISQESWKGFTEWALKPIPLTNGPTCFNLSVATRVVSAGKWFGNEVMNLVLTFRDGCGYVYMAVNTTLKRWAPRRVAFMSAMFCLQVDAPINCLISFLECRGELPSHGQTDLVWGVDVDRLYFPLFVNGNHRVGVRVNIIERKVEVFDCGRGKNRQYVEKFAAIIPRIVKSVAPQERQKQLLLSSYSIVDVPMKLRLNKSCCDCGAYALKHLECSLLGLDVSLVDDEIIMGCRQKIGVDLWEAAHDPIFAEVMTRYVPSPWERSEDKTHLFKWTDKSVVEEIEDFQDLFDVLLVDNSEFQKSVRAGEAMMTRHESRIQEMEDAMCHYEEKTLECIRELRGIKALFVCCLVMVFLYHIYA
ncbi:hypothetical protein Bca52824_071433 [Brassica carinata]|uniref:Ubiquitin-like protease family profile domain-containing protein n=1 Tax=Brassica carinata TaxID=52824 RepID=A0A8X7QB92_BRACI|nr:hypothetical protein Bca52824_071433 [Brassica carinata]